MPKPKRSPSSASDWRRSRRSWNACRTSWSSCVRVSDDSRRAGGACPRRRPGDAERESPRPRRRALHGRARGRALAAPSGARPQLHAQSRSRAPGLGRGTRRQRPPRPQRPRRRRAGPRCCTSARRSSSRFRSAGYGRRARASRGMRLAVTLYDLIPEIFAERYLEDPGLRRRYRSRLELVRAADLILAISDTDRARRRGDPPRTGGSCRRGRRGRGRLVRATGLSARGVDGGARRGQRARGTIRALYGRHGRPQELPRSVPRVGPPAARGPRRLAARDGVQHGRAHAQSSRAPRSRGGHRVETPVAGFRARRGVAPALPVDRPVRVSVALRGIRVAGCRSAGVRRAHDRFELVVGGRIAGARSALRSGTRRRDRRRDPAGAHRRRDRVRCSTSRPRQPLPGWDAVADRVADAYERLLARPQPAARRRPLVAVVTPLPPAAGGVADFSYRMLTELARVLRRARLCRRSPSRQLRPRPAARARRHRRAPRAVPGRRGTSARWLRLRRVLHREQRVPLGRARAAPPALGRRARARGAAHRPVRLERRRAGRGAGRLRGVPPGDVRRIAARSRVARGG